MENNSRPWKKTKNETRCVGRVAQKSTSTRLLNAKGAPDKFYNLNEV
jgi:hypothetical protein